MRIVAGRLRGRRIPSDRCLDSIRITAGPLKEALFSMLGGALNGLSFLDLCAGSGQIALEAYSRGATVLLNEPDPRRCRQIRALLNTWHVPTDEVEWHCSRAQTLLPTLSATGRRFDLVYLDPPYRARHRGQPLSVALLEQIAHSPVLTGHARVLVQHQADLDLPPTTGSLIRDQRRPYGNTHLSVFSVLADPVDA